MIKKMISVNFLFLLFVIRVHAGLINGHADTTYTPDAAGSSLPTTAAPYTDSSTQVTVLPNGQTVSATTNCGTTSNPLLCAHNTVLTPKPTASAPPAAPSSGSGGGGGSPPGGGGGGGGGNKNNQQQQQQNSGNSNKQSDRGGGSQSSRQKQTQSSDDSTPSQKTSSDLGCPISGDYEMANETSFSGGSGFQKIGNDFSSTKENAVVNSVEKGTVIVSGQNGVQGHQVLIKTKTNHCLLYSNLGSAPVTTGTDIGAGQKIGTLSSSGNGTSNGKVMHMEVYKCPSDVDNIKDIKDLEKLKNPESLKAVYPQIDSEGKSSCQSSRDGGKYLMPGKVNTAR